MAARGNTKSGAGIGDDMLMVGLVLLVLIGPWLLWKFFSAHIAAAYIYIRYAQLGIFHAIGDYLPVPGVEHAYQWIERTCAPAELFGACTRDFSTVRWEEIATSSFVINAVLFALLVFMAFRMFRRADKTHPKINFRKTHNAESFAKANASRYDHLRMFTNLDLIKAPIDDPVLGMSLTSRQFVFKHQLINGWRTEQDGTLTPSLDAEKATLIFQKQLGDIWTEAKDLSPSEALLMSIVMPRVAATDGALDDKTYNEYLKLSNDQCRWCWEQFPPPKGGSGDKDTLSWLKPDINLEKPISIIRRFLDDDTPGSYQVRIIRQHHAYRHTMLIALLMQARRLGVLQPAEVRWLRYFDRNLWYVVQNVGRQAVFAEGAAAICHYLYEAKAGYAFIEPQVDKAVTALEAAITSYKAFEADRQAYEMQT